MKKIIASFKYPIGYVFDTYGRNIKIIDCEYRQTIKSKKGKEYTQNAKWYKYKCLECGNEDWIVEYALGDKMHIGCNVCCTPPRKIVRGINDISTTAPWMVKYFKDKQEAYTNAKYSKKIVEMICPDCKRVHKKQIQLVMANRSLSCPCDDGWSYPNKFMYSLLEQINVNFEPEKHFEWSENKFYDDYIEYNGLKIITEQHGNQHYNKPIIKSIRYRSVEEEKENDAYKYNLALKNGINYYYIIDSTKSTLQHMRQSIINSGLLEILQVSKNDIDWNKCAAFAASNFTKSICDYKREHPKMTLHQIADKFKISYKTVLGYIKTGNELGWCEYKFDDIRLNYTNNLKIVNQKPIYCEENDTYYRNAIIASKHLSTESRSFYPRQIRQAITRDQRYRGVKFHFITQEEFNKKKIESPHKVVGDFFNI